MSKPLVMTVREQILAQYSTFLVDRVGTGSFQKELLRGLEAVLISSDIPAEALDEKIDYSAIRKVAKDIGFEDRKKGTDLEIKTIFDREGVVTYRNLIDRIEKCERAKGYTLKFPYPNLDQRVRIRDTLGIKGIGGIKLIVIYTHLASIGINVFLEGYKPEELGSYYKGKELPTSIL